MAPNFTERSIDGEQVSLSQFVGERHVVLVFNRGFACPFCRRHMASLRRDYPAFADRGAEIVVIGPEKREIFRRYWRRERFPFVGVPDPAHTFADLYGQRAESSHLGRLPSLVLVDRSGWVRYQYHGRSMRDFPSNRSLLFLLDQLNGEEERPIWKFDSQ